jgi:hypothetical protein
MAAQNMYRIEINIHKKTVRQVGYLQGSVVLVVGVGGCDIVVILVVVGGWQELRPNPTYHGIVLHSWAQIISWVIPIQR